MFFFFSSFLNFLYIKPAAEICNLSLSHISSVRCKAPSSSSSLTWFLGLLKKLLFLLFVLVNFFFGLIMASSSSNSASTPAAADFSLEEFCLRFDSLNVKIPKVENYDQTSIPYDSSTNSLLSNASTQNGNSEILFLYLQINFTIAFQFDFFDVIIIFFSFSGSNMNISYNNNHNAYETSDGQSLFNPFEINAGRVNITNRVIADFLNGKRNIGNCYHLVLKCYHQNNYQILELLKSESNVACLATCQGGSLTLQNLLASNHLLITRYIFYGVLEFLFVVMTDQYGHYLFEKLVQSCDACALFLIVTKITWDSSLFIQTSLNKNGLVLIIISQLVYTYVCVLKILTFFCFLAERNPLKSLSKC